MKIIFILLLIFLSNCSFDKVILHHGVNNLQKKQLKLEINNSNINQIIEILGPPSTKGAFDNDVYIYIERKTSSSKLKKLGKKDLIVNNVLVLELDNRGILLNKKIYNKDDMNKLAFNDSSTGINYAKKSFIYNVLSSVGQKIDDPLGKKRIKN